MFSDESDLIKKVCIMSVFAFVCLCDGRDDDDGTAMGAAIDSTVGLACHP